MGEAVDEITFSQGNVDSFWEKVNVGAPDECWEWNAGRHSKGYGQYWCQDRKKVVRSTRFMMEMRLGRALSKGELVLHSCDNPPCNNYMHLSVGSQRENIGQSIKRGRRVNSTSNGFKPGERHKLSKLDWESVRAIRSGYANGVKSADLAEAYDVTRATINDVVAFKSWREV